VRAADAPGAPGTAARTAGYVPLDISPVCNVDRSIYRFDDRRSGGTYLQPRPGAPPIGLVTMHGFPFQVGAVGSSGPGGDDQHGHERPCFLAFGADAGLARDAITLPIHRHVRHVLIAHALLDTELWRGGDLGREVARYRLWLAGGAIIDVPIRERFEIGHVPLPWGQYPFLCVPDRIDHLEPARAGDWERFGFRMTEVIKAVPDGAYVWPWTNPYPESLLETIELVPASPPVATLVVAGVTLSDLDEEPILRATARPVRIDLPGEHGTSEPLALEVTVDRGIASYTYPLPQQPLDEADPTMRGFGAPANPTSDPSYVRVAALPSATLTLRSGGEAIATVPWGQLLRAGEADTGAARLRLLEHAKNWVQVDVVDAGTEETVPCRIAFHSPDGVPYPPHGHHAPIFSGRPSWNIDVGGDVALGQIAYSYIDGRCEGWLPRGRVLVDVARGFEYEPLRTWVTIEPETRHLRLELRRWIHMNREHTYSGDTHVHFLSTQGALTEARGEDLNVVNLLLSQWGHLFSNTEEFTGRAFVDREHDTIVHASQENRQHILGHLSLLGLKRPVMPWASGGPGEAELGGGLDVTLARWADAAHEQGATVVVPHIPTPNGEAAVLIATGRADAVEMLDFLEYEHLEYYRYLNGGYRLPLVGGTDKMSNETPVGLYRTYVRLPDDVEFSYEAWLAGLRAGSTFLSGGALMWFSIEGQPIGGTVRVAAGTTVEVDAVARSIFPLHTLQVIERGRVVAETTESAGSRDLRLHTHLRIDRDTWFAARAAGPGYTVKPHYDERRRGIVGHTSPIYATVGSEYRWMDPATARYMLTLVDGGLSYVRHRSPQHPTDQTTHHHGLPDHIGYLEAPFLEAAETLHRRMHELGIHH
jgi:hypothetical protein